MAFTHARREHVQQDHQQTNERAQAHRWTRLVALTLVTASVILGSLRPAAQAQLTPGTILVIDQQGGTGNLGALFRVDPATGTRTLTWLVSLLLLALGELLVLAVGGLHRAAPPPGPVRPWTPSAVVETLVIGGHRVGLHRERLSSSIAWGALPK
jgi:hypothetical protein